MEPQRLTDLVKRAFEEKPRLTINELYKKVETYVDYEIPDKRAFQHRVRSRLHTLKKSGYVERIGHSQYEVPRDP